MDPSSASEAHWNAIGRQWIAGHPDSLWRLFTDHQQAGWLSRWLTLPAFGRAGERTRVLKTDLFDEAVSPGLVSQLAIGFDEVHAIDIAPDIVQHCQGLHPALHARVADVCNMPYPNGYFDAVFSGSTLDHFPSAQSIPLALVEIARVLKPRGQALITLDNPHHPIIRLRNGWLRGLGMRIGLIPYQMGSTFTASRFRRELLLAGFGIHALVAVQHCPRVALIPLFRCLSRGPGWLVSLLMIAAQGCEVLCFLPTRWWTGHYLLAAVTRHDASPSA